MAPREGRGCARGDGSIYLRYGLVTGCAPTRAWQRSVIRKIRLKINFDVDFFRELPN